MIDGWENKTNYTVNDLENCTIIVRGDYTWKELDDLLNLDKSIRLPTADELEKLYDWDKLSDFPDAYWDREYFNTVSVEFENNSYAYCHQLILLKEGEK
jgi:hypothetical protein